MRHVKPHYYDEFQCIADKCPDTCCAGWQIVIDDDTLEKYERYIESEAEKSAFALRLGTSIDWEEGCFLQNGGRCAMLNERNLCDLITAKGEEYLCDTCNRYPRHIEEFDGVREYSLSLSCPVAAERMLRMKEQTEFLVEEDDLSDPLEEEFEDFDFMLFTQLEDAREVIFQIINNRQLPITERMAILMEMARQMQDCIDEDRLFDMQDVVEEFAEAANGRASIEQEKRTVVDGKASDCEKCGGVLTGLDRFQMLKDGFEIYTKLERLREEWTQVLEGTWRKLYQDGYSNYEALYEEFAQFVSAGMRDGIEVKETENREGVRQSWDVFLEQILTFFIYTYFCGAVYDECIYSKVAMSVMSACYIQEFCMYTWLSQGKQLSFEDCITVAYCYAREIEHSDLNLNDLEQWLMDRM